MKILSRPRKSAGFTLLEVVTALTILSLVATSVYGILWQAGNAAFMRNWPYAFSLGQADDSIIKDKFDVTLLPSGGSRNADTLGGWQLAVSKYSKHPAEAAALVKFPETEGRILIADCNPIAKFAATGKAQFRER